MEKYYIDSARLGEVIESSIREMETRRYIESTEILLGLPEGMGVTVTIHSEEITREEGLGGLHNTGIIYENKDS